MEHFDTLIGKTIKNIEPNREKYSDEVSSLRITFTDGTIYSLIGGNEEWSYNGDGEVSYDKIDIKLYKEEQIIKKWAYSEFGITQMKILNDAGEPYPKEIPETWKHYL